MMPTSSELLLVLWRVTWQAAALAALVFLVSKFFRRTISPSVMTLLWALPILRLLLFVIPASSFSLYNVATWIVSASPPAASIEKETPLNSETAISVPSDVSMPTSDVFVESSRVDQADDFVDKPSEQTPKAFASTVAEIAAVKSISESSNVGQALPGDSLTRDSLTEAVLVLWIVGVVAFSLRYLWAQFELHKIIAAGQRVSLNSVVPFEALDDTLSNDYRHVRLVIVENEFGPAVTGILRPTILLPKLMLSRCSNKELQMALTHELEHIRRYDTLLLFVAQLAIILHWCSPLAYWLKRRVQEQAEIAVDAATLHKLGLGHAKQYAELLFKVASQSNAPAQLIAMARKSSSFRRRIDQLTVIEPTSHARTILSGLVLALLIVTGLSDAASQEQKATPSSSKLAQAETNTTPEVQVEQPQESKTETSKPNSNQQVVEVKDVVKATEDAKSAEMQTFSGRVVDVHGKGVPNAELYCLWWSMEEPSDTPHRAIANANGEFKLTIPKAREKYDPVYTWVHAEGHGLRVVSMRRALTDASDAKDISISLPALEKVSTNVQVTDPSGRPVAGALICPSYVELPNGSFQSDEPEGMGSPIPSELMVSLAARTDEHGKASFNRFPKGLWYGIACETKEFGRQDFEGIRFGTDSQLQLSPVGSIRGKIASEDRALFKGYRVYLKTRQRYQNDWTYGFAECTFDENGEFHIPVIVAGSVAIIHIGSRNSKTPNDRELVTTRPYTQVEVQPNACTELVFEAPPTVRFTGVVLTSDTRQPVAGAEIHYRRDRGPHSRTCFTNEAGEFEMKVVPGKVDFQMTSLGDLSNYLGRYGYASNFPKEITEETKLEIFLPVRKTVKGRLQDASGKPIANQKIARHSGRYRHLNGYTTTDESGDFEMYVYGALPFREGYWIMVDQVEPQNRKETVVYQMSNNEDFYVLERPRVPALPTKQR